jgi:hypothetical protein
MTDELTRAEARLREISEETASSCYGDGAWTRKELLGHLIDSATNNRYQIVKTLVDGAYTGPSYDQEGWVRAHRYTSFAWAELVELWRAQNLLLANVVGGVTREQWGIEVRGEDRTVRGWVDDYLWHLAHHLRQM